MTDQHIRQHALSRPNQPAVIMAESGNTLSYAALSSSANQCAQLLHSLGLRRGDRFAIFMENRLEYIQICWAGVNSGLFFTPVSTHLKPDEIAFIVDDCDAKVIFISDNTLASFEQARVKCPKLKAVINVSQSEQFEAALSNQADTPLAEEFRGGPMVYSSGTTGRPKGILPLLDEASPLEPPPLSQLLSRLYGFSDSTVYLSPAPMYHTAPLKFSLTVTGMGGTVVMCERFEAERALAYIEQYRVSHSQWVPTMFSRFLKLPEDVRGRHDFSSHKVAIHAAAPCPLNVKRAMIKWWGPIIYEYYAGSESVGLCLITPKEFEQKPGSVGKAVKGIIHILDDDGNELPNGETGTIFFEGGGDFNYHKDPEKTRAAHSDHGWTTFGDLGHVDDEGYLYLSDRRHDLIISGGVNIYPQEAENLLIEHPQIADAAVFGIPHDEYGEEVKACVQLLDPALAGPALEAALISYCREHLSHVKCPRSIDFLESLPRQANGKLYKRELRQLYL